MKQRDSLNFKCGSLNGISTKIAMMGIIGVMGLKSVVQAQTVPTPNPEPRIQSVYAELLGRIQAQNVGTKPNGVFIAVAGSEAVFAAGAGTASGVSTIESDLFYASSTDANGKLSLKANLTEQLNSNKLREVIADGRVLHTYDGTNLTFGSSAYDVDDPAKPKDQSPTYLRDLIFGLSQSATASGRSSYAVRFLRDLFSDPNGATYHSWMPGIVPVESPFFKDPFSGQVITGTDPKGTSTYEVYQSPTGRMVVFEILTDSTTSVDSLERIYYYDARVVGNQTIQTRWSLIAIPTVDFTRANFTPYPASLLVRWRPVIGPTIGH